MTAPMSSNLPTQTGMVTRTARLSKIIELLQSREVRSQTELAELLAADGLQVT